MASRSNALAELTRFWLQTRHGCLLDESVPVRVPYATSDIDLMAMRPDGGTWPLPSGHTLRLAIIETKDEHDFDPEGRDFAKRIRADIETMGIGSFIAPGQKAHFSMLRQEHYAKALERFGTDDFDRLFVVHAPSLQKLADIAPALEARRIHWLTVREILDDLITWYGDGKGRAALRHTLIGDLWHLLVGYCGLTMPSDTKH